MREVLGFKWERESKITVIHMYDTILKLDFLSQNKCSKSSFGWIF